LTLRIEPAHAHLHVCPSRTSFNRPERTILGGMTES
jgi:hypothetical protein